MIPLGLRTRPLTWREWIVDALLLVGLFSVLWAPPLVIVAQQRDPGRDTPKILSEVMALKIGKLHAERQVYEQALLKLSAQQDALRAQTQITRKEYDAKVVELDAVIVAAAAESGLTPEDLKAGWAPSPEERKWVKTPATSQP